MTNPSFIQKASTLRWAEMPDTGHWLGNFTENKGQISTSPCRMSCPAEPSVATSKTAFPMACMCVYYVYTGPSMLWHAWSIQKTISGIGSLQAAVCWITSGLNIDASTHWVISLPSVKFYTSQNHWGSWGYISSKECLSSILTQSLTLKKPTKPPRVMFEFIKRSQNWDS